MWKTEKRHFLKEYVENSNSIDNYGEIKKKSDSHKDQLHENKPATTQEQYCHFS